MHYKKQLLTRFQQEIFAATQPAVAQGDTPPISPSAAASDYHETRVLAFPEPLITDTPGRNKSLKRKATGQNNAPAKGAPLFFPPPSMNFFSPSNSSNRRTIEILSQSNELFKDDAKDLWRLSKQNLQGYKTAYSKIPVGTPPIPNVPEKSTHIKQAIEHALIISRAKINAAYLHRTLSISIAHREAADGRSLSDALAQSATILELLSESLQWLKLAENMLGQTPGPNHLTRKLILENKQSQLCKQILFQDLNFILYNGTITISEILETETKDGTQKLSSESELHIEATYSMLNTLLTNLNEQVSHRGLKLDSDCEGHDKCVIEYEKHADMFGDKLDENIDGDIFDPKLSATLRDFAINLYRFCLLDSNINDERKYSLLASIALHLEYNITIAATEEEVNSSLQKLIAMQDILLGHADDTSGKDCMGRVYSHLAAKFGAETYVTLKNSIENYEAASPMLTL